MNGAPGVIWVYPIGDEVPAPHPMGEGVPCSPEGLGVKGARGTGGEGSRRDWG